MRFLVFCMSALLWSGSALARPQLCDTVHHVARDDVTYRPSPNVIPADLNATPISLGEVEIPLNAYLVQELGLNVPVSAMKLGNVTIKENGSVIYQGRDISGNVNSFCDEKTSNNVVVEKTVVENQNDDRQVPVEPVKSVPLKSVEKNVGETDFSGGFGQDHINASYND